MNTPEPPHEPWRPPGEPIHRYRRFTGWDYTKGASLFVTLTLEERRPFFGRVENCRMILSPLGEIVQEALETMPRLNPGLSLFGHVVMPDHVHFNCCLAPGLPEPLRLFGNAIRRFKNYTTKQAKLSGAALCQAKHSLAIRTTSGAGMAYPPLASPDGRATLGLPGSPDGRAALGLPRPPLWRQGCHDYLLVSRSMIDSTERYIAYNPPKWTLMHGAGHLRVLEPVFSPRLDIGDYWKAVGNLALLGTNERLVSLRVSRQVADIPAVVARMERAVERGFVVISGFVSKGEQAVRDMLCRRRDAKFIRVRASCIPNERFKPESAYVQAFAEGRCLELGKGNDEIAFTRGACLDVNREIIDIATSALGLSVYFTKDGLLKLAEHHATGGQP